MRKYLSRAKGGKPLMGTPVSVEHAHWVLFEALIRGAAGHLTFTDYSDLRIAVIRRDVSRLFHACARIDSYLTEYDIDSNVDISTVRAHRQVVAFLKKFPFTIDEFDYDRREAGKKKFLHAEHVCDLTNQRIKETERSELPRFVRIARELIHTCLGELTPSKIISMISNGNHGPGATRSSTGNRVTPYYKYMDFPYTCTKNAFPYAAAAISGDPHWLDLLESSGRRRSIPDHTTPAWVRQLQIVSDCVEIENSDKVTFVPKDAKTERPIAVGSSLNIYLQLGVKEYMESRLRRYGIDLRDQSRNQRYAELGSRHYRYGSKENPKQFSTIDLASASDTISFELVKLLLDPEWFAFLCDLRHEEGILDGELIKYNKFSAMGNGFTFPLESLIFWAVSKAALIDENLPSGINDLTVYGDDIICRQEGSEAVINALVWCGFSVNTEKSFLTGPFKESCGSDYFCGHDVRPFYLKRRIRTYEDVYFVVNSISRKCRNQGISEIATCIIQEALSFIPPRDRRYLPLGSTDDCGICVPLSLYRRIVRNPVLYEHEFHRLNKDNMKGHRLPGDYFYIRDSRTAKQFSGYSKCKYYLSLRTYSIDPWKSFEDRLHLESAGTGTITRRNCLRFTTSVETTSSWNGDYTIVEARRHIMNFIL